MPVTVITIIKSQNILEDKKLYRQLNASNFDLAIVDLIANECRCFFKDTVEHFGSK